MNTRDNETQTLRRQLAKLTAEAANNELILKRAQKRELSLLDADSLGVLFDSLTTGLSNSFGVPEATVVLCDPDHEVRHLVAELENGNAPDSVVLVDRLDQFAAIYSTMNNAVLGPYRAAYRDLFRGNEAIASVAIMPLSREKRLMGSLNLGSTDPRRFTTQHATDFLEHLAVIASFCLENVVNRARLRLSGFTDVLTGWHNRRYLEVRLNEEVARAQRNGRPLGCLMIDIDHFKTVNDNHGHLAGDDVLRQVAGRIASQVRSSDVSARFGGEEFVVLLTDTEETAACNLAERIRHVVSATPVRVDKDHALTITVSVGVSTKQPARNEAVDTLGMALIDEADSAMYRAKKSGRDQVFLYKSVPIANEID